MRNHFPTNQITSTVFSEASLGNELSRGQHLLFSTPDDEIQHATLTRTTIYVQVPAATQPLSRPSTRTLS